MDLAPSRAAADDVRPLRHAVLRSHQPYEKVYYPGDESPDAGHFVVRDAAGGVVGCATVYRDPFPGTPDDGATWRLRGMATAPGVRGTGAGGRLLAAAVDHVRGHGGRLLWCNARTPAVGFYERFGWETVGDEFVDADAGPHYRMRVRVG